LLTTTAKGPESDTIMQGVVLLWPPTGWPPALIVLIAGTVIPRAKIVVLAYLPAHSSRALAALSTDIGAAIRPEAESSHTRSKDD